MPGNHAPVVCKPKNRIIWRNIIVILFPIFTVFVREAALIQVWIATVSDVLAVLALEVAWPVFLTLVSLASFVLMPILPFASMRGDGSVGQIVCIKGQIKRHSG